MKLTMTQKREYERPRMNVVELRHHGMLMTSGQGEKGYSSMRDYSTHEYVEE